MEQQPPLPVVSSVDPAPTALFLYATRGGVAAAHATVQFCLPFTDVPPEASRGLVQLADLR